MSHLLRNGSACLMMLAMAPTALAEHTHLEGSTVDAPKELSVAPLDHIEYPPSRPEWVDHSVEIDEHTTRIVVVSGPSDSSEESQQELKLMQRAAVSTYLSRLSDEGQYDFYPITDEEIERELVTRRYGGELLQGDTTRYEHAVELRFDEHKRAEIAAAWNNVEVRDRLGAVGVLVFLGTTFLICTSFVVGMFSRRVERREKMEITA